MKYQVISAFIDKRDGRQIDAGEPVPEGLDRDTVERLVAAQCLRPLEAKTPTSSQTTKTPAGGGADLFPEDEDEEGDDGEEESGSGGEAGAGAGEGGAPAGQSAAPGPAAPNARRTRRQAGAAQ